MLIGVDTGGTFTDFVFLSDDGRLAIEKVPSTPADPSLAVAAGLEQAGLAPGFALVHGTTVATNALLERRGAKTALLTTQGCRDVLEIARQTRDRLYTLAPAPRRPLVPRDLRFEAPERLDWRGAVVTPLDGAAVEQVLDALAREEVESLAVCFLFSFLDPSHEQEVGRRARARGLAVSLSSEIAPEVREYERTSTVCANAFVAPLMARYLEGLRTRIEAAGGGRLAIMQSNGGTLRVEEAAENAVKTALSGPAGGIVAAVKTAQRAGIRRIMTLDMGGTSTDVALVDGEPRTMRTGDVAGLPLLTPMLDVHTVGAGGGSLVRLDAAGALRVGPQSAGADPGPVAYGKGTELTVTDADLFLGRLPGSLRLAGRLSMDLDRVKERFARLAETLHMPTEQAASGVLEVIHAQMARALRHISTERGRDPADYVLVSFGGAGGLHACALARALGIARILVPRHPGAFSALGLALADVRREYARSCLVPVNEAAGGGVRVAVGELAALARSELVREGVAPARIVLTPFVEARYVGQSYALAVPFRGRIASVGRDFHRAHRARYGHADPTQTVEVVTVGLTAVGTAERQAPLVPGEPVGADGAGCDPDRIAVFHDGAWYACPVFERAALTPGRRLAGPALVVQPDATTWIEPEWSAVVDGHANLLLTRYGSEDDQGTNR